MSRSYNGPMAVAPDQRVVMSKAIFEQGRRPVYVYRDKPVRSDDSGWTLTVGELRTLLKDDLTAAHISHLVEAWPELGPVFADSRDESDWEWDEASATYREVYPPTPRG